MLWIYNNTWLYVKDVNPLKGRGNYSATSNNMKLVHWPLMGGLLHSVHSEEGPGRAGAPPSALLAVYQLHIIRCGNIIASAQVLKGYIATRTRSASECSHYRTRPSCGPFLAPVKVSRWYLKRLKSYDVDEQTNKQTNKDTHKHTLLKTTHFATLRCSGGKPKLCEFFPNCCPFTACMAPHF